MTIKEFSVLLMVCTIWGLHFVVMKLIVGTIAEPLFYSAVRMTFVALLLSPKLRWHPGMMRYIFIAGIGYGALNYAFMFPAIGMTTASAAAVAIELYVPFSIILSMIIFKTKIGKFKLFGILLAFIGVSVIGSTAPAETAGPLFLLGFFLVACAAMSEAVGANMVKLVKGVSPLELLAWFAVIGTLVLWPLSFLLETGQLDALSPAKRMPFIAGLLYTTILVSIIAHASYYWLLQRLPIHIVSTSGLLTTVIGVSSSILILGEAPTAGLFIGAILTLIGVGIILLRDKKTVHDIST